MADRGLPRESFGDSERSLLRGSGTERGGSGSAT